AGIEGPAGALSLWDARSGKLLRRLGDDPVSQAAFSPDGRALVAWESKGGLRRWDLTKVLGGLSGKEPTREGVLEWKRNADGPLAEAGSDARFGASRSRRERRPAGRVLVTPTPRAGKRTASRSGWRKLSSDMPAARWTDPSRRRRRVARRSSL